MIQITANLHVGTNTNLEMKRRLESIAVGSRRETSRSEDVHCVITIGLGGKSRGRLMRMASSKVAEQHEKAFTEPLFP